MPDRRDYTLDLEFLRVTGPRVKLQPASGGHIWVVPVGGNPANLEGSVDVVISPGIRAVCGFKFFYEL